VLVANSPASRAQSRSAAQGLFPGELKISPITANFVGCPGSGPYPATPPECATTYSVTILKAPPGALANLRYDWYLQLKLIDRPGEPMPYNPGGAAFDPSCNNAEFGKGKIAEGSANASGVIYEWSGPKELIWYHGDSGVYSDSSYGCDHTKMGPSGHQGVVTLVLDAIGTNESYPGWVCQANYYGTNSGVGYKENTDCYPAASHPSERFLVATAYEDEITARHMLLARDRANAKTEIEHSLSDLKDALAQEEALPSYLQDPYWIRHLNTAMPPAAR